MRRGEESLRLELARRQVAGDPSWLERSRRRRARRSRTACWCASPGADDGADPSVARRPAGILRQDATVTATRPSPPAPRGTLFFVHGANETSVGLMRTVGRIRTRSRDAAGR
jgi:hypothetical protein